MAEPPSATESLSSLLTEAMAAVSAGYLDKAASLLGADTVDRVLASADHRGSDRKIVFDLAEVLSKVGREDRAEQCYLKLLEAGPDPAVYNKLGCLCLSLGRLFESVQYQQKAAELRPESPELLANLARAHMETGDVHHGIEMLRKAVDMMPTNAQAHSNLLFRLHQLPQMDPQMLWHEHRRWGQTHAPATLARKAHENIPDPDRKLHVGYISPDFRRHSVAYFLECLLDGHDRSQVAVYGYGNVEYADEMTEQLKRMCDRYHNIYDLTDEQVAALIAREKMDILVDLAGHAGDNRLLVMARKPAPVQVTYLGYPDTTGLEAIDYRLTDTDADLPDSQRFYSEQLFFLPDGFLCYKPRDYAPPVAPLPAEKSGYITFGSFNNSCKLNPTILGIWADILRADTQSRLLLKIKAGEEPEIAGRYLGLFSGFGIDPARITICGWKSPIDHFKTYSEVDIALDTFPYNGTTTTCEALWMGVPTVSLVGQCHASRVGLSILSRVGLEFFAAATPQEYVAKAHALASNRSALAQMRLSMRARIATSGLCHGKAFARSVEVAYRTMWRRWCRSRGINTGSDRWTGPRQKVMEMRSAGHIPPFDVRIDRTQE